MYCICFSCQILIELDFYRQIFEKYLNLMKIRPVGAELFYADGRTDRHDNPNSRLFQFYDRAYELHVLLYNRIVSHHNLQLLFRPTLRFLLKQYCSSYCVFIFIVS
jgi:hypothetical protein